MLRGHGYASPYSRRPSGWEIARQVREGERAFPVIYTTAASAHEWPSQRVPNSVLLTKPFAPAQLITALSQLLNTGSPEKSMLQPSD
jgi:CheY-like chemotaxis protein